MKAKNGRRAWTKAEDDVISKLYATNTIKEIAIMLDRPAGSVGARADTLHLVKAQCALEESRIGTVERPRAGVLIHHSKGYGKS